MRAIQNLWRECDGVLSFEWTLIATLVVLGVVGGIASARDAIIDEFGDAAESMLAVDQSFTVNFPLTVIVYDEDAIGGASNSEFFDSVEDFEDCDRDGVLGQDGLSD